MGDLIGFILPVKRLDAPEQFRFGEGFRSFIDFQEEVKVVIEQAIGEDLNPGPFAGIMIITFYR